MEKTTNYDMFIFRNDNRSEIKQSHVNKLVQSIKARNLLEMRPISVNGKMEIMDGQHRVLAAKALNVPIYYRVDQSFTGEDMLALNVSKSWGLPDYLNYYVKNGYQEYIKLNDFNIKNKMNIRTSLTLTSGTSHEISTQFKNGTYKFNNDLYGSEIDSCWLIIDYIKKSNPLGQSTYLKTNKFWNALLKLVRSTEFNEAKFMANLSRMTEKCCIKATINGYCSMLMEINNYRNAHRIDILDKDYD